MSCEAGDEKRIERGHPGLEYEALASSVRTGFLVRYRVQGGIKHFVSGFHRTTTSIRLPLIGVTCGRRYRRFAPAVRVDLRMLSL